MNDHSIQQRVPEAAETAHQLGLASHRSGRLGEAIGHLRRAVALAPAVALYHANLGEMLRQAGEPAAAADEGRRALALDPGMAMALGNLGAALYDLKEFAEAARVNAQAVAAQPDFAEGHCVLGNALYRLHRFDDAVAAYRRALALKPDYPDALANLGTTLHHAGEYDEAIATLRYAVALAPHHAGAHSGLGLLLLMRGDFAEGFDEYEWRLRTSEQAGPRFPARPWQGDSLAGRHLYIQAEQGLGDTMHFVRYIPQLTARGAQVTLRVQQQLVALLKESQPGITVLGPVGDVPAHDYDAALLSLPRLLRTRPETIPAAVPYLRVPEAIQQRWRNSLASMQGLKIGTAWAGNPEHMHDVRRSIDARALAPLTKLSGTSFASLQVGLRALAPDAAPILDLAPRLTDFCETAGAIVALDLVITVDTAVAHLAGALGKPVWLLLPWVADWRWMLEREDSPWYPGMRLFRQRKGEAWDVVIARVSREIKRVVRGEATALTPFRAEGERRAARAATIIAAEATLAEQPARTPADLLPPGQVLLLAEQKRRQNLLGDAEELTRSALSRQPDNADALHKLALVAYQSGRLEEAMSHLRRAVAMAPDVAIYQANLGEMSRLAGRVDDAVAAGRRAVALDPAAAAAHSNLGIALFEQGRLDEALALQERAITLDDRFAQAHSNRGNVLQAQKRFAEAEPSYRRALDLRPDFLDGWNNLGTCLRELGRPEEAEQVYRKALALAPDDAETLDNLALALLELRQLDEAAALMRRALQIDGRPDKFHLHYGSILLQQERFDEAYAALAQAMTINPANPETHNRMANVALHRGDAEAAIALCRRAIALKPDLADAHNTLGNALQVVGRLPDARAAYLEALRFDPTLVGAYYSLSDIERFAPGDPHLAAMEALAARPELPDDQRMPLDFALGKVYADMKDYRRSFTHLARGNAAKRATVAYDEAKSDALFARIEATFTKDMIAEKSGGGDPSHRPIFVLGMPRSGTTLVEQILAGHPAVHGAGELKLLHGLVWQADAAGKPTVSYPEYVPALDATSVRQFGAAYVAALGQLGAGRDRVTDKMPANYYYAGLIHLALPNAVIIHCVRDPVDTCVSCFSKLFAEEQIHTYDLAELGRYYLHYERLMAHWHRVLPPGRILDVAYEDVVADLDGQARRIVAHAGLPWDIRCLEFHRVERPVRTASSAQVRQPIYSSSIARWRVYEQELAPLLDALSRS